MIPQTPLYRTGRKMEKCVISLFLRVPIRHSIVTCLALLTVCALLLLTTVNVLASTVTINDQAGVLDAGRVQADAAQLPDPIFIYTTETFTGDQDALNTYTRAQLPNQDTIAIGIDTVHRHLSLEAGTTVQLSNSQASDAVSAFQRTYDDNDIGGDYTRATINAIDTIRDTLGGGGINFGFLGVMVFLGIWGFVIVGVIRQWRRDGLDSLFGGSSGGFRGGGGGFGSGGGSGGGAGGSF
jgi:hypothetical protein